MTSAAYADAYGLELSRELMSMTAWVWEPTQAQAVQKISSILGSEVKLVPLALYISGVILFWFVLFFHLALRADHSCIQHCHCRYWLARRVEEPDHTFHASCSFPTHVAAIGDTSILWAR